MMTAWPSLSVETVGQRDVRVNPPGTVLYLTTGRARSRTMLTRAKIIDRCPEDEFRDWGLVAPCVP
jgi:hypothetical protein